MKVLLTGASKGIGLAIYKQLLLLPEYDVYVIGLNPPPDIPPGHFFTCDLRSTTKLMATIDKMKSSALDFDVIINNAGFGIFKPTTSFSLLEWEEMFNVNVTAPFVLIKSFLDSMIFRNHGKIINISSDADKDVFENAAAYCATKHALLGMSNAIRMELKGKKISITTISPGRVDTYFNGKKPGDRPISLKPNDIAMQVINVIKLDPGISMQSIRINSALE